MDSLFDEGPEFDRDGLARRLAELARERIYIGGSSWKYEGWLGQIYSRSRYLSRGRFSKAAFEANCLAEYASVFPAVCGDFAFYQFPSEEFWHKLFSQTPEGFQFAFKVPEQITCASFPMHARYGLQGGLENPTFLDPVLFDDAFLRPLRPFRAKTGVLIFEFGAFARKTFGSAAEFLDRLDPFLRAIDGDFRYAVEIRNAEFLGDEYFGLLREHNVAHVFNSWTRMPDLPSQIAIPGAFTADFTVCRALLKPGRLYEDAVKSFAPYAEVQEVCESAREGLRELVSIARAERRTSFLFVNNRLEGNTPGTVISIID